MPNEVIPTVSGEVALYNNAVPIAKNMVRRAKTTSVIMGTVVTKVLIKNPKTGSQKTVLMNKIKFENKDYWVLSSELKPKA